MGVGGQRHAQAALPPGKTRYPLYWKLGGPQGRSGRVRQNVAPTGIRSPDRAARSESLYRLSHPGPFNNCFMKTFYGELVGVFAALFFTRQLFLNVSAND